MRAVWLALLISWAMGAYPLPPVAGEPPSTDLEMAHRLAQSVLGDRAAGGLGIAAIQDKGSLVVGMASKERYPYCFRSPAGEQTGADLALARRLAGALGVSLVLDQTALSPEAVLQKLCRHEVDIAISRLKVLLEDAKGVLFTRPYLKLHYLLLLNRVRFAALKTEGRLPEALKPLRFRLGTLTHPLYRRYARSLFPSAQLVPYSEPEALKADLRSGKVLAGFCDQIEGNALFIKDPALGLWVSSHPIRRFEDELAMALPWDQRDFAAWINLWLALNPPPYSDAEGLLREYPWPASDNRGENGNKPEKGS